MLKMQYLLLYNMEPLVVQLYSSNEPLAVQLHSSKEALLESVNKGCKAMTTDGPDRQMLGAGPAIARPEATRISTPYFWEDPPQTTTCVKLNSQESTTASVLCLLKQVEWISRI